MKKIIPTTLHEFTRCIDVTEYSTEEVNEMSESKRFDGIREVCGKTTFS